jgi:hypothetical protein
LQIEIDDFNILILFILRLFMCNILFCGKILRYIFPEFPPTNAQEGAEFATTAPVAIIN